MHSSATVGWLLTALCAVTGGACLVRARGAGGMQRRTARSEALMGLGMAVMALSGSVPVAVPPLAPMLVFVLLFAAVGAWELALLRESRQERRPALHHVHHLVGALAMVYMTVAAHAPAGPPSSTAGAVSGHAHGGVSAGLPLLTGVLLAYFAVYVLRTGLRLLPGPAQALSGVPADTSSGGQTWGDCSAGDLPGLAAACRLAMGTGMLAMLMML
ncbi:MAG TPA: DUF5134 domain-containing protein [Streptomyces sp.]|jgi:hypothetical protein|nr:DUF5134 domain-containing protein [Streptomyces sp.]